MSTDFKSILRAHKEADTCYLCKLPVLDGEARHGSLGCHWSCHKKDTEEANAIFAKVGGLDAVSKRKQEGKGKTAQKAMALAVAAIETQVGQPLYGVTIWNQKGVYRGPRWDLDAWGINFRFQIGRSELSGTASSLATMTDCVNAKSLIARESGMPFTFNLDIK